MPAKLKIYRDKDCEQEIPRDSNTGMFLYLVSTPINGIQGEDLKCKLYLKNIGTRAALRPEIIFISTNNQTLINKDTYVCKDIPVDEVVEVVLDFTIKPWSAAQISENTFILDYYSLPDTTSYSNPYNYYAEIGEDTNTYISIEGV